MTSGRSEQGRDGGGWNGSEKESTGWNRVRVVREEGEWWRGKARETRGRGDNGGKQEQSKVRQ